MAVKSFSGGAKLQAHLRALAEKVSKSATLKVGFLDGATYPDGTSVAEVAAVNEFGRTVKTNEGSYYQLPRPFFRGMISKESPHWGDDVGGALKAKNYDAPDALNAVGESIQEELQQSIVDFSGVPLAPSTIAAKGSAKQLIDTKVMLRSVGHEVEE